MTEAIEQKGTIFSIKSIHTIIGLLIAIVGPFLKAPTFSFPASARLEAMNFPIIDGYALITMSDAGWHAVIIFAAIVYLWMFVDNFWPSIFGVIVLGFTPHYAFPIITAQYVGSSALFPMFFLFFFISAFVKSRTVEYVSNYMLSREFLKGKPWVLTATLFVTTYFAAFLNPTPALLTILPVVYMMIEDTGYKPGDKYTTFLVGNVVGAYVLGFCTDIIKGMIFFMQAGYNKFVDNNPDLGLTYINIPSYILFAFVMMLCVLCILLFVMRFVMRIDVEKVRNFDTAKLTQKGLPPMNWQQKTILVLFLCYVTWQVLPALLPSSIPGVAYINAKKSYGVMVLFLALILIRHKGEPVIELQEMAKSYDWKMFFLLAAIFLFSGILTQPVTNIPIILELGFSNLVDGLDSWTFVVVTILAGFVLTNVFNSIVIALVLTPVVAATAVSYGIDVMPVVVCFIYIVTAALLTPGAGVPGAFIYGNKEWLPGSAAALYAVIFSAIVLFVIIFIGLPFATFLFT